MSNYYIDQLLASNYNGVECRVVKVSERDKLVTVTLDGKLSTKSENYMGMFWHEVGTRIPTLNK